MSTTDAQAYAKDMRRRRDAEGRLEPATDGYSDPMDRLAAETRRRLDDLSDRARLVLSHLSIVTGVDPHLISPSTWVGRCPRCDTRLFIRQTTRGGGLLPSCAKGCRPAAIAVALGLDLSTFSEWS